MRRARSGTRGSAMARILILGGAGFVGFHLARRLAQDPANHITLVDDLSRGRMDAELTALLSRPGVAFVKADLTDPAALSVLPREWDQVYMLAAVVGVRHAMRDPARVIHVNTRATLTVLDWLTPAAGLLFFASTSEVYAGGVSLGQVPVPTPESVAVSVADVHNPRFAYAGSKILGEAAVIHYARARGIGFVIARLHNVYGPRMGVDHVIPELCLRALDREDPFRVYGPEQRRAFCYIADALEAVTALMATEAAWGSVVNIGNDAEETTIGDLATLVLRVARFEPAIERVPAPPGSVARRCPDLTRLRALTGFVPKVTLDSGLRDTLGWYRAWHEMRGARA